MPLECFLANMSASMRLQSGGGGCAENIFPLPKFVLAVLVVVRVTGHQDRFGVAPDELKNLFGV